MPRGHLNRRLLRQRLVRSAAARSTRQPQEHLCNPGAWHTRTGWDHMRQLLPATARALHNFEKLRREVNTSVVFAFRLWALLTDCVHPMQAPASRPAVFSEELPREQRHR